MDEERLEGADLGAVMQLFPLYMSGPGLPNHQMFTTNPAAFSLSPSFSPVSGVSLSLSLFLWGPLKQALPVITNTQFTKGLWSKWNVSSHMMVCALYSYSVEKAEQRKQGKKCSDCCQLLLWFSRCSLRLDPPYTYVFAFLYVFMSVMLCLHERVCT